MESTRLFSRTPYSLHVQLPDGTAFDLPILKSTVTLGRAPENDLVINHPSVSRQHATFKVDIGGVWVEDQGSANGTYIGGSKLIAKSPVRIPPGKAIRFGEVTTSIPGLPRNPGWTSRLRQGGLPLALVMLGLGVMAVFGLALILGISLYLRSKTAITGNTGPSSSPSAYTTSTQTIAGPVTVSEVEATQAAEQIELQRKFLESKTCPDGTIMVDQGGVGRQITSIQFLDLPFPYDGGNANFGGTYQQFILANQRNMGQGGRINSFFDHYLPLYPAPKDPSLPGGQEPVEAPVGGYVLRFDGVLSQFDAYSGHPGYDYSTFEYQKATTPLFAAADGVIYHVGTHSASGALFVEITHTVPSVGNFMTVYWHLNPDIYFDAMLGREGEPIKAGTRIGTMGNTGFSTGHHLHFEVRFDANNDGHFPLSEVVDPYGYIPSPQFPIDPWYQHSFVRSDYLWIYPLGTVTQIGEDGGGQVLTPEKAGGAPPAKGSNKSDLICVQPQTFPPGSTVYWSNTPAPAPSEDLTSPGGAGVLAVVDPSGIFIPSFPSPVRITIPYLPAWELDYDPGTLLIYFRDYGSNTWQPLQTRFDAVTGFAYALTQKPGSFALLGKPKTDRIPPLTEFQLTGAAAADDTFYDVVTVTLSSSDPSGISKTVYSLDSGTTWKEYNGPFQVTPNGIPSPIVLDTQMMGGLPGTIQILASSVDNKGNVEDPPKYIVVDINPTKNPDYVAGVETLPVVPTPEPQITQAITLTEAMGPDVFPQGVNPLTGQTCQDSKQLSFSPAAISVTNFPISARPQAGLSYASWVFEMYIGEGMTRFLPLFYCNFPQIEGNVTPGEAVIGPIRSGRLPYESIRKLFSGFLVMASADPTVGANLGDSSTIFGSDEDDINSALIDVSKLESIAEKASLGKPAPNLTGNLFDPTPPEGGLAANNLWIYYNYLNQILWNYDPASGTYLRSQDNADGSGVFTPSTDRLNGERLGFDNVIILFTEHTVLNRAGTMIDMDLLFTRNSAYLFRDGQAYPILWNTLNGDYEKTTGRMRPFRFTDKNGNPFPLKPGNIFIEMVDLSTTIQEVQPGDWKVRFYSHK